MASGRGHSGSINAVKISPDEKVSFFMMMIMMRIIMMMIVTMTMTIMIMMVVIMRAIISIRGKEK